MSNSTKGGTIPRATIHKQILDAAAAAPEESLETLAGEIPAASTDLVERVLNEYGDPASVKNESSTEPSITTSDETTTEVNVDDLSTTQLETLWGIYENPGHSQRELGERFGVAGSTIFARVSDIPGFEWAEREDFVTALFDDKPSEVSTQMQHQESEPSASEEEFQDRMVAIEQELVSIRESLDQECLGGMLDDPELIRKLIHASFQSEMFSEDEELRLLGLLLNDSKM